MHWVDRRAGLHMVCCAVLLAITITTTPADVGALAVPELSQATAAQRQVIPNRGQWDDSVLACISAGASKVWLVRSGLIYQTSRPELKSASFGENAMEGLPDPQLSDRFVQTLFPVRLEGASITVAGLEPTHVIGSCNFLLGPDPRRWVADVPILDGLTCRDIYPGIDLVIEAGRGVPEVSFRVMEGSQIETITVVTDIGGDDAAARVVQAGDIWRLDVAGLIPDQPTESERMNMGPLASNSSLEYGTYLGGTGYDAAYGMAIGTDGTVYVAGNTESANFPTANPYDPSFNSGTFGDVFVTKLSADGQSLVYSTFIGGSGPDILAGIAVDNSGRAYLTGVTGSSGTFPILGAYDSTYSGSGDAFIMRLSASGSQIEFSTYAGGSNEDYPRSLAIDDLGNAYICGHTRSVNFPTLGGLDTDFNGGNFDAFILKLDASGASLGYSSYLGGNGDDQAFGIAVDGARRAYVRGWTVSANFPVASAFDASFNGGDRDVFIARVNAAGSALDFSTYFGGEDSDYGVGIAVDDSGSLCLAGVTRSTDFPLHAAYDSTLSGLQDLFLAKFGSNGQSLTFCTLLGGSAEDFNAIAAVDLCQQIYVTGYTYSTDFPMVAASDSVFDSGSELIVAHFSSDGSQLQHSTFIGGGQFEFANAIALHGGRAFVAGVTNSSDFPAAGSYSDSLAGDYDAFVAVLGDFGVNECGCQCICAADPVCDGIRSDVVDVVQAITVAFRGGAPILDPSPTCPFTPTDVNCSGATDVVDIVKIVSVAFRGGSPALEYCEPCTL